MSPHDRLRNLRNFADLIRYLEEELAWPLQQYGFDELTFTYEADELGLREEDAAKVKKIHQLRPLASGQSWGIFFIEFEKKRLPVVVLRRILSLLVIKKRASANKSERAAWQPEDLLFISAFGDEATDQREIAFAHFHQESGDLPTLRVLGWDGGDTPLKLEHVDATLHDKLRWPADPRDLPGWRAQWARAFRHRIGHVIRTADGLAERLAALARGIRGAAQTMMAHESDRGALTKLYKAFQTALIHDLTPESFADTYAQTITYGLLTAAISRTEMSAGTAGTFVRAEDISEIVPVTNPFLKEMLQTFLKAGGRKGGIDFDELGIQDVVELLRGDETDLPAILRDFGNKNPGEDPVIQFYEDFLKAYDAEMRIKRGVFYTPPPVVSYIVRSVHQLLQTEFGLADGLASTVTWGEMVKRNPNLKLPPLTDEPGETRTIDPKEFFVQILDIATGTATFIVEVIDVIHQTMTAKWKKTGRTVAETQAAWNDYVPKHLLPRVYGFELMMAPYAIAHMKVGLKLYATGYRFGSNERVRIYLTNTLEPKVRQLPQIGFEALAHEAAAVNEIKWYKRFTVVVGNPPYARISSNMGAWISGLIEAFKYVDGIHFGEIKHWLHDDYVKFLRFGLFALESTGCGILGSITNRGYLSGPTFRGMRCFVAQRTSSLHVLDLHGGAIQEECDPPAGLTDENVFDIKQGVAITIASIMPQPAQESARTYSELWGNRRSKYAALELARPVANLAQPLHPASPRYDFIPRSRDHIDQEYSRFLAVNELFPVGSTGIQTSRDGYVVDFEKAQLQRRFTEFCDGKLADDFFRKNYALEDGRNWCLADARKKLRSDPRWQERIVYCQFRPLDIRWMLYHASVINWPRPEVMPHMLRHNIALIVPRNYQGGGFDAALVSRFITEVKTGEATRGSYCYPLYLYGDDGLFEAKNKNPELLT